MLKKVLITMLINAHRQTRIISEGHAESNAEDNVRRDATAFAEGNAGECARLVKFVLTLD